MTEPTNDLEALAAKLDEQLAWATKHCPNAPYVPVRAETVALTITALRSRPASDDAVERVAKAIYGERDFEGLGADVKATMFAVSRAAIAALRDQGHG